MATNKPILCVDFDGVVNSYSSGWQGADVISDPPVPGALLWLWRASQHFSINIYSSRSSQTGGIGAMQDYLRKHIEQEFLVNPEIMFRDSVDECVLVFMMRMIFPTQKPPAHLSIDDRAIQFQGDWNDPSLNPEALLLFKPWNKR